MKTNMDTEKQKLDFAARINPANLGYSPKMGAIVGAIIGHDYGARDARGNRITGISITSDGFVMGSTDPVSSGALIGRVEDLQRNLARFYQDIGEKDAEIFQEMYAARVQDWRTGPGGMLQ